MSRLCRTEPDGQNPDEQPADPPPLTIVDHRDRNVGLVRSFAKANESRHRDRLTIVEHPPRNVVLVVDVGQIGQLARGQGAGGGEEPHEPAAGRQPLESIRQQRSVVCVDRAQVDNGAVAERRLRRVMSNAHAGPLVERNACNS